MTATVTAFDAIGTTWRITTDAPLQPEVRREVDHVVEQYDRTFSRFRPDSAVTRLAETGGPVDLGPYAPPLLDLLIRLAACTAGAMTPLVGGPLEHLGYGPGYRLDADRDYRPAPPIGALHVDGTVATLDAPAVLDVGSAGKGQLIDLVAALLAEAGHTAFTVDAGGDLRTAGPAVQVALEHPFDTAAAIGVVEVRDAAIAGSAPNRRTWTASDGRRLHHVLDGRTGVPVDTVAATWALAESAMLADALATALFLVQPEALEAFAFTWLRMATDGRAHWSPGLPGEVFR
ncbi:MAG TPA: FAD:protein FMN transferase [Amnibacterium sp.]|nr:FAD:protein FMN transferase [Amnibacterium sp.]